eukprot:TRINITY_DN32794_c0_g1_i1.p1 TRINITY_DN32794_c0_g1~~TRINITY_DN32794_c0_g1_i1.p1  ORF type:complete len:1805 (-),score=474.53 TRINITY_DN32794_c0_g1_i1:82-5496(-)
MGQEEGDDVRATQDANRVVALYDFDPTTIDWPFNRQKPLALATGQVVEIVHDDGTEWALGFLAGVKETLGYFPKNYTVSIGEYQEMMRDFENQEQQEAADDDEADVVGGPPETRAIPAGPLPAPLVDQQAAQYREEAAERALQDQDKKIDRELPELVYPGIAEYPAIEARPPQATAFEVHKSRLLREMPPVPDPAPEEPAPPEDDIVAARWEVEAELAEKEDIMDIKGGTITYSRCSTPMTHAITRPERDFVRKQVQLPANKRDHLRKVNNLMDLVNTDAKVKWEAQQQPYKTDLRVRHTCLRVAHGIEPAHMRFALQRSSETGAKWKQMFRPGFNDIVNQSFQVGCNSCILSHLYLRDKEAKEQFQRLHVKDVNGTMWFELMRRKEHLFYMRMDFIDVMMAHPDAWGFPDTNRLVAANPGEPVNPFHGWYSQHSINPDAEMEDVEFRYTLRLRSFPETTFQALALGKIPEWIKPYLTLHAEAEEATDLTIDEDEEAPPPDAGGTIDLENNLMMEAGLEDGDDLYVKLDELKLARERTTGPDVLDAEARAYRLKGLSAMRIFLRSRGNPDNMKQALISPKMVKDMAAQLGIQKDHSRYWYCMFALRYPLAPEWEAVVRDDTRWYLNLTQDRLQPVHPMIRRFREHLSDVCANEFLWDFRGFVKMKCSECGLPDSVVWCQQCTDYYCAPCFLNSHKSKRGKKHWPLPVPGCRYLSAAEAKRFKDNLPLLNVGYSNQRRFLARSNQSDRNGDRNGDTWLWFHADTFQAALVQTPESHWCLKRKEPPRLPPGKEGFYYNFATDTLADDESYILVSTKAAQAVALLQRHIRGALTRRAIKRETRAALILQKTKVMWDVQKIHGSAGKNAGIIKGWFRKHRAKEEKLDLEQKAAKVQGVWRGILARRQTAEMLNSTTRFQAAWRGIYWRRRCTRRIEAAIIIQKGIRGMIWGRRLMRKRHYSASRIQAMVKGIYHRRRDVVRLASAIRIQARIRGLFGFKKVQRIQEAATKLQTNWRRFQAQLEVKKILYIRMEELRQRRSELLRTKLEDAASIITQRNFRRHHDHTLAIDERREKGDADKRTTTMLVAFFQGCAALRSYIHPWWRHLPPEIQSILRELKEPIQKTIANQPVKGKLSSEQLGKRGLNVAGLGDLTYQQASAKDPDLASHMLLVIARHLLSHVPAELFPETIKWACYAIGHQAVDLFKTNGYYVKEEIVVGKEMPPHPHDSLHSLFKDLEHIKTPADKTMQIPDESIPLLVLNGMPTHHRHVFLTAEVLVTMRQALDSPAISTEDHLKFQGLDSSAGAQLMEILGSEIDHRLPLDWPNQHGTVAALAQQLGMHIVEVEKEGVVEVEKKGKGGAKAKAKVPASKPKPAPGPEKSKKGEEDGEKTSSNQVGYFNRAAVCRIFQQVGYLMRDQHKIMDSILGLQDEESLKRGDGVRQGRFVLMTDKLFDMADRAPHDHCSFVLAVVLFHMVVRGLMMRLLYHRAGMCIQKRYRYWRLKKKSSNSIAPAICIQRFWRGLRAGLKLARQDAAVQKIQHSWKAYRWNQRSTSMLKSTLNVQRVWQGALIRNWIRTLHLSAIDIQRFARGMMVRVALDPFGIKLCKNNQMEMSALLRKKSTMPESQYWARCAALAGKARIALARHRDRNVDLRRNMASTLKSKHARLLDKQKKLKQKGSIQPQRLSIFEPFPTAARRIAAASRPPAGSNRYGAVRSGVLQQVQKCHKRMSRSMPGDEWTSDPRLQVKVHAAAKRGQAAMVAKRVHKDVLKEKYKKGEAPMATATKQFVIRDDELEMWMRQQFEVAQR